MSNADALSCGHVQRMDGGHIQKYIFYGDLTLGRRGTVLPTCVTRMSAQETYMLSTSTLSSGSALLQHIKTSRGRKPVECRNRQSLTQKGAQQFQQTWDHMRLMWQRRSLLHWSLHPQLGLSDAASAEQAVRHISMNVPWSSLTDRCL